ncbi:MAG: glycogen synthase GlgA [Ruminococcus sp.]|nr:glycogen synthase GlgA [Ruminococcus sp.]
MKNVLFASSEVVPFIKTGGLADVAGSLPKYFDKRYYDVRVILPKYSCMAQKFKDMLQYKLHFYMEFAGRDQYVGVLETRYDGVTFYFIDNEFYFTGDKPYGDWHWDIEKFMFFDRAVLSALPLIGFKPDIIHCHDWQTGLIPVYLHDSFQGGSFFRGIKTVMTIHNLKFQGNDGAEVFSRLSGLSSYYMTYDKLKKDRDGNMLKGGLVYADAITTVSDSYAEEIKTEFYGEGLDGLMRARSNDLRGIVNGIDYDVYDPSKDEHIACRYDINNVFEHKLVNKRALQDELCLKRDDNKFMIGIVSRLTDQKGFDLIAYMMEKLCGQDIQLVVLGTGDAKYEDMFRHFAWKYPQKVSANVYYSDPLSHRIYASCDAFLMPSLFEPCGLSQLMALRYGTLPIVRETGGLKDTVIPYNQFTGKGTGFSFSNYNAHDMYNTIMFAHYIYVEKRAEWNEIIKQAMSADFSWQASAAKYQDMYDWLTGSGTSN